MGLLTKIFGTYSDRELKRLDSTVQAVLDLEKIILLYLKQS